MFHNSNNRSFLLNTINLYKKNAPNLYKKNFDHQLSIIQKFNQFIESNPNCFSRNNINGHITGSAFVVDENFSKVLFTYHAKLERWLQLGGHADGEFIVQKVALKEAYEESGIENFNFVDILNFPHLISIDDYNSIIPFDLDIHLIPERKTEPAHYHYDVRFILVTKQKNFKISHESLDLKWIYLNDVSKYSSEESTLRQVYKLQYFLNFSTTSCGVVRLNAK